MESNKNCFTIFSFGLAKELLRNGCDLVDIGLNNKNKGIVFHFENTPKMKEIVKLNKQISDIHNKINSL